jgi:hypothetical protein
MQFAITIMNLNANTIPISNAKALWILDANTVPIFIFWMKIAKNTYPIMNANAIPILYANAIPILNAIAILILNANTILILNALGILKLDGIRHPKIILYLSS